MIWVSLNYFYWVFFYICNPLGYFVTQIYTSLKYVFPHSPPRHGTVLMASPTRSCPLFSTAEFSPIMNEISESKKNKCIFCLQVNFNYLFCYKPPPHVSFSGRHASHAEGDLKHAFVFCFFLLYSMRFRSNAWSSKLSGKQSSLNFILFDSRCYMFVERTFFCSSVGTVDS